MRKILSIKDMKKLAKQNGGECLSTEYVNVKTKLRWKCKEGHEWSAVPNNIQQGKWCPTCGLEKRAVSKRLTIEEMKEIAKKRNGKCLSTQYINSTEHLKWQCEKKHEWKATPNNIKRGKWCPNCAIEKNADSKRKTIKDMQKLAKKQQGECLSKLYVNMNEKLTWKCKNGHIWEALPSNISAGKWCPTCVGKGRNIKDMIDLAKSKNGKCLSSTFQTMNDKLLWQCEKGHKWESTPNSILNSNTWCPECSGNTRKTLEDMRKLAEDRGGKCLSKEYINIDTNLKWECSEKHTFMKTPYNVGKGVWCPICTNTTLYFNEEKCRFILENIFNKNFYKTRKELGNGWELDGYNEELKLAFEYNGAQHYKYSKHFHRNKTEFKEQQKRDLEKMKICEEKGIFLLVIPYTIVSDQEKIAFIENKLTEFHVPFKQTKIYWKMFYKNNDFVKELNEIALSKGGKCLSNEYLGTDTKLEWECEQGHVWKTTPYYIKKGSWCPICLGRNKDIDDMRELAKKKGGKCLSHTYINNQTKLKWECSEGHKWKAIPNTISRGGWCPYCSSRSVIPEEKLKELNEIAKKHGGECLSSTYTNNRIKIEWKCHEGHKWKATSPSVLRGSWCPECAGNKPSTIEDMHKLAKKKEGECLSNQYINSSTKLIWKCKEKHIWEATPSDIKQGKWCAKCGRKQANEKRKKYSIDHFKKMAESKRGECLSEEFVSVDSKLKWRCHCTYEWETIPYLILNGSWCPKCSAKEKAEKTKLTIEDMHETAKEYKGECLSDTYINNRTKLTWKCSEGHIWEATPNNIRNGHWCSKCSTKKIADKQRNTMEKMHQLAKNKDGKCLSSVYENAHVKLEWECKNRHVWLAKPNNVQQGKWCPTCAKENRVKK